MERSNTNDLWHGFAIISGVKLKTIFGDKIMSGNGEFTQAVSDRICNHMNKDHADAVLTYVKVYGKTENASSAEMIAIDAEGMDLSAQVEGQTVPVRVPFAHPLADAKEAHVVLVEMLKQPGS
jgi:putative heme iron utilization protein